MFEYTPCRRNIGLDDIELNGFSAQISAIPTIRTGPQAILANQKAHLLANEDVDKSNFSLNRLTLILLSWEGRKRHSISGSVIMQADGTLQTPRKLGLPGTPTLILVSVVVYYVCVWFFVSRNRGLSLPPGPKRAWLTGNLRDLPKGMLWLRAAEWGKTYGELA